ncbi:MAG: efflux RND transporter periplasmic adaptor subunit [Myxococcota bacterium]
MKRHKIGLWWGLAAAAVVAIAAVSIWRRSASQPQQDAANIKKRVEVVAVAKGTLEKRISLLGKLHPAKFAQLRAKKADVVQQVLVQPGQQVKAKALLLQLEQQQEQQALALAQQQLQLAQTQLQRSQRLAAQKSIAQEKLQQAQEKQVNAQKQLQKAQTELAQTRIQAPFAGVCASVAATVGQTVQKDDVLLTLQDTTSVYVHIPVPAQLLAKINSQQHIWVNGQQGSIVSVPQRVDSKTATATVKAQLPSCPDCVMGSMQQVQWVLDSRSNVLQLPLSTLFMKEGQQYVVLVHNNKTKQQQVSLGLRNSTHVEVLAGLQSGDMVVLHNPQRLSDNTEVEAIVVKQPQQ